MTDTQNNEPDIEDRGSNIRMTVQHIIDRYTEMMFGEFDRLHRRNIHDNDMVEALTYLGPIDLLDEYAEWAEIDLRQDDNTTLSETVPDPAGAESYKDHPLNQVAALKVWSLAQLQALPDGAVVRDSMGDVAERRGGVWCQHESAPMDDNRMAKYLPATILDGGTK